MIEIIMPIIGFSLIFLIGLVFIFKPEWWLRFFIQPQLNVVGWDKNKDNKSEVLAKGFKVPKQDKIHVMEDYFKYHRARTLSRVAGIIIIVGDIIFTYIYFTTQV